MTGQAAAHPDWVRRGTALLHAHVCQSFSWSEDCQRPDGGAHARDTMRPVVMAALRSPDPVGYLHDRTCSAQLDKTFVGGCPERDRHVAHMAAILGGPS